MRRDTVRHLRRAAPPFLAWTALSFTLYLCFISAVDGPELVAGALISVAAGLLATTALRTAGRGLLTGGSRWYAPAAAWPLDLASDCALLARAVAARALGKPVARGEIRTLRLREDVPPALAGLWLSSTPGACVLGGEGRDVILHALSGEPSRVERALTAAPAASGDGDAR